MEEFYPYTLTIHLLCAILFIGYLFVDVFVLGVVKKKNPNFDKSLFSATGVKIMPFVVLLLFLSGGALAGVGGKIKCRKRKIKCRIFATNYLSFNLKLKL
ncbi:hypothetical protein ACU9JR_001418 [Campylobacter jejuni]